MKRETTILIAAFLLLNSVQFSWAQDEELSDKDLQTLMDDKTEEASEVKEVEEKASVSTPETVSSETVDVQDLESLENSSATAPDIASLAYPVRIQRVTSPLPLIA